MRRFIYLARSGHTFVFTYDDDDRGRRRVMFWSGMMASDCEMQFDQSDFEAVVNYMVRAMTGKKVKHEEPI